MLRRNRRTALRIENKYYFRPMKDALEEKIRRAGEIAALDSLTEVMRDAQPEVEKIIRQRRDDGYIRDMDNTRKSVAGNGFQGLVAYSLIRLQKAGNTDCSFKWDFV